MLKPPGTKRLKLKHDELLSTSAFKFNLRRYVKGKLNGMAVRVPLLNGSLTDCVFELARPTTVEEVNGLMQAAAEEGELKGILGFEEQPLVSTDFINDRRSGIVDAPSTMAGRCRLNPSYPW